MSSGFYDAQRVKQQADIVEAISDYVQLKRQGTGPRYIGLCPFHREKTPSFNVNSELGFYKCFGCDEGGDVFEFVQRIQGLTFLQAVEHVAKRYGFTTAPTVECRPRITEAELTDAESFRSGFSWWLERYLELLKELHILEEPGPEDRRIFDATKALDQIRKSSPRDLATLVKRHKRSKFVRARIAEAEDWQVSIARLVVAMEAA